MDKYHLKKDTDGRATIDCRFRGQRLLAHPMFNKGSAFSKEERRNFGLTGLLPDAVSTFDLQITRAYKRIMRKTDALERYIGLAALQDRNEILYYRVVLDHLEELAPIVYTPTVGLACERYSHIFRRGRGLVITPEDKGHIYDILDNAPFEDTKLIVVTDNERILGLGDQGVGGIGIPIGKLTLYTVGAGIHPSQVLPISLDVGTDNKGLLDDSLYLGWRHPRLRGAEYDALIDEFVEATKRKFPSVLLQWEDFKKGNAFKLLDRYRDKVLSFNDDIQGTAAVALSAVMATTRISDVPMEKQKIVIMGAGAAGVGIGRQLRDALKRHGVEGDDLVRSIAVLDSTGLLHDGREITDTYKREFVWPASMAEELNLVGDNIDLLSVIKAVQPTVLIGTSGQPGSFTEEIITQMGSTAEKPLICPLSNPTANSEAVPEDIMRWTDGRAVVATGSPFAPVQYGDREIKIGQANNVFIFPGVGLGALAAKATSVTDSMFTAAAECLGQTIKEEDLSSGMLFPSLQNLRPVTKEIAVAVSMEAIREGVAPQQSEDEIRNQVAELMWEPEYPVLKPV
jgi:malate dehydrogenase (oxaloacetate-decarboxylating)